MFYPDTCPDRQIIAIVLKVKNNIYSLSISYLYPHGKHKKDKNNEDNSVKIVALCHTL